MKIGILGAGNIGRTIGEKWAAAGHDIVFGVRDTRKPEYQTLLGQLEGQAAVQTTAEAISHGEIILVALPGNAVAGVAAAFGSALDGKILIDATNKVGSDEMNNVGVLAEHAPDARIYRAFNSLGWENFQKPALEETQIDLFFCGPEGDTRRVVAQLIEAVGLRPIYVGGLEQLATVDNIARLWFALALGRGRGRRLAFKVLTT